MKHNQSQMLWRAYALNAAKKDPEIVNCIFNELVDKIYHIVEDAILKVKRELLEIKVKAPGLFERLRKEAVKRLMEVIAYAVNEANKCRDLFKPYVHRAEFLVPPVDEVILRITEMCGDKKAAWCN